MYAVVIFNASETEEETVEAVPLVWLTPRRSSCYWPPFRTSDAITKAARLMTLPSDSWERHAIRFLKQTETYQEARSKLLLAEATSDLNTEASGNEGETGKKSKRKRVVHNQYSDESDEEFVSPQPCKKSRASVPTLPLATPPQVPQSLTIQAADICDAAPIQNPKNTIFKCRGNMQDRCVVPAAILPVSSGCSSGKKMTNNDDHRPLGNATPKNGFSGSPTTNPGFQSIGSESRLPKSKTDGRPNELSVGSSAMCQDVSQQSIGLLMKKIEEVKSDVGQVRQLLLELLKTSKKGVEKDTAQTLPEGIVLPLQSFQQVENLERKLRNFPAHKQQLTAYLGLIGGLNIKDVTRRIMKAVMTNGLAIDFNFLGNGGKHAFSSLLLKTIVTDAVRLNGLTKDAVNADIESVIKEWLRTAKDRDGGRKRRFESSACKRSLHYTSIDGDNADSETQAMSSVDCSNL